LNLIAGKFSVRFNNDSEVAYSLLGHPASRSKRLCMKWAAPGKFQVVHLWFIYMYAHIIQIFG